MGSKKSKIAGSMLQTTDRGTTNDKPHTTNSVLVPRRLVIRL